MTRTSKRGGGKSPFLRATEAAEFLGLARSTLEHYRWIGSGPIYRKHGGLVVYHIDDLNEWSNNRRYRDSGNKA